MFSMNLCTSARKPTERFSRDAATTTRRFGWSCFCWFVFSSSKYPQCPPMNPFSRIKIEGDALCRFKCYFLLKYSGFNGGFIVTNF